MVCAPVRSIIASLKLGDYLSVQAHKPCSISHMFLLSVILPKVYILYVGRVIANVRTFSPIHLLLFGFMCK